MKAIENDLCKNECAKHSTSKGCVYKKEVETESITFPRQTTKCSTLRLYWRCWCVLVRVRETIVWWRGLMAGLWWKLPSRKLKLKTFSRRTTSSSEGWPTWRQTMEEPMTPLNQTSTEASGRCHSSFSLFSQFHSHIQYISHRSIPD